jgi:hypothetical protein
MLINEAAESVERNDAVARAPAPESGGPVMRIRFLVVGTYLALAGLGVLGGAGGAGALLIDDFTTDQAVIWMGVQGTESSRVSGAGILGGERDMVVELMSSTGMAMGASLGTLNYGHFFTDVGTGLIVWDGDVDDPGAGPGQHPTDVDPTGLNATGLGGVDFTDGGTEDKIALPLLANNFSAPIVLTAYTDADNFSTATISLPGSAPERLIVFHTDFIADPGGTGADFTNIGAFSLFIDGSTTPGLSLEIEDLVPEPSTATLLLLGILGITAIRRCGWTL